MKNLSILALSLSVSTAALASEAVRLKEEQGSPPSVRQAAFKDLDDLKKQAWKKAEAGDFATAREYLHQAASLGDRRATLFLARQYAKGTLLCKLNPEKAAEYEERYKQLVSTLDHSKDFVWADDAGFSSQEDKIKYLHMARSTPWLAEAHDITRADISYMCFNLSPLSALKNVLDKILAKPKKVTLAEKERALTCLQAGVQSLNSSEAYTILFTKLSEGQLYGDKMRRVLDIALISPFHDEAQKAQLTETVQNNVLALQSEWYPQLVDLLNKGKHSLLRTKYSPMGALTTTVDQICKGSDSLDKEDEKILFDLFSMAYKQLATESVQLQILKKIACDLSASSCLRSLKLVDFLASDTRYRDAKYPLLVTAYDHMLTNLYWYGVCRDESDESPLFLQAFIRVFRTLHRLEGSPEATMALSTARVAFDNSLENYGEEFCVELILQMKEMKDLNPEVYDRYASKFMAKKVDRLVEMLLKDGALKQRCEGSSISLDAAVRFMFNNLTRLKQGEGDTVADNASQAYRYLVCRGDVYLETYSAKILKNLRAILAADSSLTNVTLDLLGDRKPAGLRDGVFQIVLKFLTKKPLKDRAYDDRYYDGLFKHNCVHLADKNGAFFAEAYDLLRAGDAIYGIQKMWLYMEARELEVRLELVRQIRDYFKLKPAWEPEFKKADVESDSLYSAEELMSKYAHPEINTPTALPRAIGDVLSTGTLSMAFLHQFCEIAKRSGIHIYLNADHLTLLQNAVLRDEGASLKDRSEAFNKALHDSVRKGKVEEFRDSCLGMLKDSPLRAYASLAFRTLIPQDQPISQAYATIREFIKLEKLCPEIQMLDAFTRLYTAEQYAWTKKRESDAHIFVLDRRLTNVTFDPDGRIYGFLYNDDQPRGGDRSDYTLYCCEPDTGYALWSAQVSFLRSKSLISRNSPECTVGLDRVFVHTGENHLEILDRATGGRMGKVEMSSANEGIKLTYAGVVGHHFLMIASVVGNDDAATLNVIPSNSDLPSYGIELPPTGAGRYRFSSQGNYFASTGFGSDRIDFFNSRLQKVSIHADLQENVEKYHKHSPYWSICGDSVHFDQKQARGNYKVVSHNLATNQEEWAVHIKGRLECSPQVSFNHDRVFLLTREHWLLAVSLLPESKGQILWEVRTRTLDNWCPGKINHIQTSTDGRYVYGLESTMQTFFRYDANTGAEENLGEMGLGHATLMGARADGRVYVKPHN